MSRVIAKHLLALALGLPLFITTASAEEQCSYGLLGTIPFKFAGFPIMMPSLEGKIHGTPALILADTGNYGTQMTMTGAMKRELPLELTTQTSVGVSGTSQLYSAQVSEYSIGTITGKPMRIPVIGQQTTPSQFDGILGVDFLMQADLEVDYLARKFRLFKGEHCERDYLAYWDKNASVLPILPNYSGANFHPHIIIELNGVRMNAIIDTGASTTVVTETAARRAGVFPHSPGVREDGRAGGFGTKVGHKWIAKFDSITIGNEELRNPTLNIIEMPRESLGNEDILLGNDFLRAYRILFANGQGRIYLTRTGNPFPPRTGKVEPWVEQEARAGNPDAHLIMATRTEDKDEATRLRWIQSAAQLGQPRAQHYLGAQAWRNGRAAEAVDLLKSSIKILPSDWQSRLELYLAQLEAGDRAGAEAELERASALFKNAPWISDVFQSFLGKKPLDLVLAGQRKITAPAAPTSLICPVMQYEPWLRRARPDIPARSPTLTKLAIACKVPALPVHSVEMPLLAPPPANQGTDTEQGAPHA